MFGPDLTMDDLGRLGLAPDILQAEAARRGLPPPGAPIPGLEPPGEVPIQMAPPGIPTLELTPDQGLQMTAPERAAADASLAAHAARAQKPSPQAEPRLTAADFAPRPGTAPRPGVAGGGELAGLSREAKKADAAFGTAQKDASDKSQGALGERQRILEESALLGEQKAAETGAFQRRQAQEVRALQQEQAAEQAREQDALKAQAEKAKRVASDYFRDEDGSVRVGEVAIASLAVALGAMGSALAGGPNAALQIVNDNINRDIDAERGLLDDMEKQFADKGAAREAARAAKIDEHQQALASFLTEYTAPEQRLKFEEMSAALEQEKAGALAQAAQLEHAATYQGLGFRQQNAALRAQAAAASAKGEAAPDQIKEKEAAELADIDAAVRSLRKYKARDRGSMTRVDADERRVMADSYARAVGMDPDAVYEQLSDFTGRQDAIDLLEALALEKRDQRIKAFRGTGRDVSGLVAQRASSEQAN